MLTFHYTDPPSNQLSYIDQNVNDPAVDPTGVHRYVTFSWGTLYGDGRHWHNFLPSLSVSAPDFATPLKVLTGCIYANNTGYHFTYGDWGIITKIENLSAPQVTTRSYVSYNYPPASTGPFADAPTYTLQTVSPDGSDTNTSLWSYTATTAGPGIVTAMQVSDPLAQAGDPNGSIVVTNIDQLTGLLSSLQMKNSAGNVLRTISYLWTTSGGANVPDTITTTLNDTGQQSSVHYSNYDAFGNAADVNEYDFGGQLLRHNVMTFATTFLSQHILGLPTQVLLKNGAGSTVSRTDFTYDDAGSVTINITDAASHDNSLTVHGNLTSITRYADAVAGTGQVTRHLYYDSTGNVVKAELDCCNQKVFSYSIAYQYAYPTPIVRGPTGGTQFSTSATYQFDKGLVLSSTDENNQMTQYQYDVMNRLTKTTLPPQGTTSVELKNQFNDPATSPSITRFAMPTTVTVPTTVTTLDGLGHISRVDTKNGSTLVSSTTYSYDKLWRIAQGSNPFAPGETPVYTTYIYDALGRSKQIIPPSGGFTQFDYSGNATTITDPAVKQRRNFTDALGRLTEVDEPDPAALGTNATANTQINGILISNSSPAGTPPVAGSGSPVSSVVTPDGSPHVFFFGVDHHVYHLVWSSGSGWQNQDLTSITGRPLADSGGGVSGFVNSCGCLHVAYIGSNQHVIDLYMANISGGCATTWSGDDLTAVTGNMPAAVGSPVSFAGAGGDAGAHLFYIDGNRHINRFYWPTNGGVLNQDLTFATGGTTAGTGTGLSSIINAGGCPHVSYIDTNQHLYELYQINITGGCTTTWGRSDLTAQTDNTLALSGSPVVNLGASGDGLAHVIYLGANGHVYRVYWDLSGALHNQDLTAITGNTQTGTGSGLAGIVNSGGCPHIRYVDVSQHVEDMFLPNITGGCSTTWNQQDLTNSTGNTLAAAGSPLSNVGQTGDGLQHTFYFGTNRHVYRLYWNTGGTLLNQDLTTTVAPSTISDSGTVSLNVGGFVATTCFGVSTNPLCTGQPLNISSNDVTAALAQALNVPSSPATATASQTTLTLTWKIRGPFTPSVSVLSTSHDNPASFTSPSFTSQATTFANGTGPLAAGGVFATTYSYDVRGLLTGVFHGGGGQTLQQRTYVYDGLSRIASATTPESGTVLTFYTPQSGFVCSAGDPALPCRTQDARGVVKNFSYDTINRPSGIQYSNTSGGPDPFNTAAVTYQYDAGGAAVFALNRLTKITGGSNSHTFTYDNFGRIKSDSQLIDTKTYLIQYAYNLASEITSITYPSNHVVVQNYDAIGRVCAIGASGSTCTTGTRYLNSPTYNGAGETLGFTLGNSVQGQFTYNDHLQLATLHYSKGSTDLLDLAYDYTTGVPGNNGQIQKIHYYTTPGVEDLTKSESFQYDNLGRLSAAQTGVVNSTPGAKTWSLTWSYDRLGNRLSQTMAGGDPGLLLGGPNLLVDQATNHIIGYCYDQAGNLLDDATCPAGNHKYTYDGANRLTKINTTAAVYSYFGPQRIKKVVGSTTTRYIYSGSKPIAEYVGTTNPSLSTEYVYAGSRLLVTIAGSSTTYHHPDHLSDRVETNSSGTSIRTYGHVPYGETWYETGTGDKWKFTSYERDSVTGETGLDYAQFRYYSSSLARFMSTDFLAGHIGAPQSLNRYVYVVGDPVNLTDPMGLEGGKPLCPIGQVPVGFDDTGHAICADAGGPGGGGQHLPLEDGNGGGGDGGQGGSGGPDMHRVIAVLTKCILEQFKVLMTNFQPSIVAGTGNPADNTNGQFTGIGSDQFGDSPRVPDAPEYAIISVTNDVTTKSYDDVMNVVNNTKRYEVSVPRPRGANGYTDPRHPHINYSENDTNAAIALQIFELGNSLEVITKGGLPGKLHDATQDPGAKTADCVLRGLAGEK